MLAEYIEGLSLAEARAIDDEHMLALFRAPLTVGRRACCLLALLALQSALQGQALSGGGRVF